MPPRRLPPAAGHVKEALSGARLAVKGLVFRAGCGLRVAGSFGCERARFPGSFGVRGSEVKEEPLLRYHGACSRGLFIGLFCRALLAVTGLFCRTRPGGDASVLRHDGAEERAGNTRLVSAAKRGLFTPKEAY